LTAKKKTTGPLYARLAGKGVHFEAEAILTEGAPAVSGTALSQKQGRIDKKE